MTSVLEVDGLDCWVASVLDLESSDCKLTLISDSPDGRGKTLLD